MRMLLAVVGLVLSAVGIAQTRPHVWEKSAGRDVMTGKRVVLLTARANESLRHQQGTYPTLNVQCVSGKLSVFVWTGTIAELEEPTSETIMGAIAPTYTARSAYIVRLRVDEEKPKTEYWSQGDDIHNLFRRKPEGFVKKLSKANTLVWEFRPSGQDRQAFTFDVRGLKDELVAERQDCGFKD